MLSAAVPQVICREAEVPGGRTPWCCSTLPSYCSVFSGKGRAESASGSVREVWGCRSAGWALCHHGREKGMQHMLQEWDEHGREEQSRMGSWSWIQKGHRDPRLCSDLI